MVDLNPIILMMKHNKSWFGGGIAIVLSLTIPVFGDAPAYKVRNSFGQPEITSTPVAIAMDAKDEIRLLLSGGAVVSFDSEGKSTGKFESGMNPPPSAMTTANGKIYLLATEIKSEEKEFQGRKRVVSMPVGVKCAVFTAAGVKEAEFALPEVITAKAARFVGNQLAIGDYGKKQIVFYTLEGNTPKVAKKISDGFRLCCGIFDFCPTADGKSILVANLGAFKVQTFTDEKKSDEFGARGAKLDEFHGCCNPVNLATIGTSAIVTVEKSPTRVKVYGRNGKGVETIEGLGELVAGCSTIPVAVDSKGAIYLASASKRCVVKCVSDTAPVGMPAPSGAATSAAQSAAYVELSEAKPWRDVSGRTVQGKLIAFNPAAGASTPSSTLIRDGKVRLLVGQKTYELSIERLVEEDQAFIAKLGEKTK